MSATVTIGTDSEPGAWARAIRHTPRLAAQVHEITGGAPLSPVGAGAAEGCPPLSSSAAPFLSGGEA